jgi:hypothetical protein
VVFPYQCVSIDELGNARFYSTDLSILHPARRLWQIITTIKHKKKTITIMLLVPKDPCQRFENSTDTQPTAVIGKIKKKNRKKGKRNAI